MSGREQAAETEKTVVPGITKKRSTGFSYLQY